MSTSIHKPRQNADRHDLVSLIGYRGTGKSTVAKLLGQHLGWQTIDSDHEIERRAGMSIKEIFDAGGEQAFRDWETSVICDLSELRQVVLALGGGVILRDENRRALCQGTVVWLRADADTICQRVAADPTSILRRPNLTVAGGIAEIQHLLAVREPLYQECADFIVDTAAKSPEQVADEIVCLLECDQSA